LQREGLDQRTDIFAFGVAAYELLTNHKPFPGDTAAEILALQLNRSDFIRPAAQSGFAAGAGEVILKCLERDPDRRYIFMAR